MTLTPLTRPLSAEDAAHFLRRTAFGATDAQIRALVGKDARTAAREALAFDQKTAPGNPFDPMQGPARGRCCNSRAARGCSSWCTARTRCARNWP
ncbi:hypothetical protein [Deinococcus aquaticus]|uniref:hypothetical protein n=1 Tax=Deinococcus aquaticus TaxID=328692 RepID=UPI00360682A0